MLAAQMAATHNATMTFARRLNHVENIPQQDSAERTFNKLARTFHRARRAGRAADQVMTNGSRPRWGRMGTLQEISLKVRGNKSQSTPGVLSKGGTQAGAPLHPPPPSRADRFARDLAVQLAGHDFLKNLGVSLIPATAPDFFLEDTPTAVLVRQVLGAIAQFEKASLVAKLKAARDRKIAAGFKCGGRKSFAEMNPSYAGDWVTRSIRRRGGPAFR
jgi:Resolvase, N terminal domain